MMKTKLFLPLLGAMALTQTALAQSPTADELPSRALDTLVVYSTRTPLELKRLPHKVELISPKTIERSGLSDLTDLLKSRSSVDVIQYPNFLSSVGIRGFSPDASRSRYVSVLINGIPSGTANLSTLSLGGVEQVELLKGPFSSIYGTNAMGGVINIITKEHHEELTGAIGVRAGSFGSSRGSLTLGGGITERLSFDLSASYESQARNYRTGRKHLSSLSPLESAILDPTTRGKEMPESDFGVLKGRLRLGYRLSQDWSLSVYEDLFLGDGIPGGGSIWGVHGASKKDLNRSQTSAVLRGRIGEHHQLSLTPYYAVESYDSYTLAPAGDYVDYSSKSKTWGAILQDELRLGAHRLVVGLDTRNQDSNTKRYKADGSPETLYRPNSSTRTLGLFAQSHWSFWGDALMLSGGIRADWMQFILDSNTELRSSRSRESFSVVSPNLGLRYALVKGLSLHAGVGTAFTAPDAYNKAGQYQTAYGITRGNPDLKPETSLTYDAGISYSNRALGIQLDATYFDTRHREMISTTPAGRETVTLPSGEQRELNVSTYANASRARMRGIELMGSYDLGSLADYRFSLRAYANATLMLESEVQMQAGQAWRALESVRKQNVTLGIEYRSPRGLELGLNGRFLGKRYERNWFVGYGNEGVRPGLDALVANETPELAPLRQLRHPASWVFSASLHYAITKQLRVGANLDNFLNEHYTEKDGYPMPGRSLHLSASYRF